MNGFLASGKSAAIVALLALPFDASASSVTTLRLDNSDFAFVYDEWRKLRATNGRLFGPEDLPDSAKMASLFVELPFHLQANSTYQLEYDEYSFYILTNEVTYSGGGFDYFEFSTDSSTNITSWSVLSLPGSGGVDFFIWAYGDSYPVDILEFNYEYYFDGDCDEWGCNFRTARGSGNPGGNWKIVAPTSVPLPAPAFFLLSGVALMVSLRSRAKQRS